MAIMGYAIWILFPPAVVSIILLILPWPSFIAKRVRSGLRAVMYGGLFTVNLGLVRKVCLAHFLFIGCLLGLFVNVTSMRGLQERYHNQRDQAAHAVLLRRKFAAERNVWIMAFATTLYVISFQLWWLSGELIKYQERAAAAADDKPKAE